MMNTPKLEIACFNLQSALIASQAGADRIELCDDMTAGGITPSIEMIRAAKEKISTGLFVMIRPRGGNFIYTAQEFESMKESIREIKKLDVNGFVFGILDTDGNVNVEQNKELLALAKPLPCTFHRAFDEAADPYRTLDDLIECGFKTILTSGQELSAITGVELLADLAAKAGQKITVMPGGGVRSSNISALREKINTDYFHSSAIKEKGMADAEEIKLLKQKLSEKN